MEIKIFYSLPQVAIDIRTEVFMKEQGFMDEFDEADQNAIHIVIMEGNQPVATCRIYFRVSPCYDGKESFLPISHLV